MSKSQSQAPQRIKLHELKAKKEPQTTHGRADDYINKYLDTRNRLLIALAAAWAVGVIAIASGSYCLYHEITGFQGEGVHFLLPRRLKEVLPLLINVLVTLLSDGMGNIHGTTLTWSLRYENRLAFRSNLRLLTSSHSFSPNKWYSNSIFLFCVVLSYATPSMIFLGWNPQLAAALQVDYIGFNSGKENSMVHVSGVALISLGVGLLGQAAITTWALTGCLIPTWSSNPIDLVFTLSNKHSPSQLVRRRGRCMMSVHQRNEPTAPVIPRERQGPPLTAHPEEKWILGFIWALVPLSALWGGIIILMINEGNRHGVLGQSWTWLPSFTEESSSSCHVARCTDGTSVLNIAWTSRKGPKGMIGTIFLVATFQSPVTLALHCVELFVDVLQDESILRAAMTPKGTDPNYSNFIAALTNWRNVLLAVFKMVTHWMFGLSINVGYLLGVNMYPPQVFYFTVILLFLAIYATSLSLVRPWGSFPATYGHLQTLADLIDEYDDRMFWGHKVDGMNGGPNYAGTSAKRLLLPLRGEFYGGDGIQTNPGADDPLMLLAREYDEQQNSVHSTALVAEPPIATGYSLGEDEHVSLLQRHTI